MSWALINKESLKEFLSTIPLKHKQKYIIFSYFIPNDENKTKDFENIAYDLNCTRDCIMKIYKESLQIILDSFGPKLFK